MSRKDITTSIEKAGLWAVYLFLGSLGLGLLFHFLLWWGEIRALSLTLNYFPFSLIFIPVLLLMGMIAHELLHAIVIFFLASSGWKAIKFGFLNWMTPYCHCNESISVNGYRLVLVFPFLILGLLPWIWGFISGIIELTIWGAIFISASGGDLLVFYLIRKLPGKVFIQDHPGKVGVKVNEKHIGGEGF